MSGIYLNEKTLGIFPGLATSCNLEIMRKLWSMHGGFNRVELRGLTGAHRHVIDDAAKYMEMDAKGNIVLMGSSPVRIDGNIAHYACDGFVHEFDINKGVLINSKKVRSISTNDGDGAESVLMTKYYDVIIKGGFYIYKGVTIKNLSLGDNITPGKYLDFGGLMESRGYYFYKEGKNVGCFTATRDDLGRSVIGYVLGNIPLGSISRVMKLVPSMPHSGKRT